jgi:hypothetical protein
MWTFCRQLILFISLFNTLAFGACVENPDILGENETVPSSQSIDKRLQQIVKHQNMLRTGSGSSKLDIKTQETSEVAGEIFMFTEDRMSGISVLNKGSYSYNSGFDDGKFLNTAYRFGDMDGLKEAIPLAVHALKLARCPTIDVFRYMSEREFALWEAKDLKTLRAWPGLPGPASTRYWGYDTIVTHTTPFTIWSRVEPGSVPCRTWTVPKSKLIEWAKKKKINFGLTGPTNSKEYEIVFLESTWDELIRLPSGECG